MDGMGSILLADDEETFRESTCRLLERQGFQCRSVTNGDETVEALSHGHFDLLIADIRMPGNPDLRVVRAAKESDKDLPVILVTGYPTAETAIRSLGLSVMAYLTKPVDFDEMLLLDKKAVARSRDRRSMAGVRERLQICMADLDAAQATSVDGVGGQERPVSIGTIRTLASCLSELLTLGAQSGADWGKHDLCELLDCPQKPVHRRAIAETIEVLKKTKGTFKSKTLAELRTKLEHLFGVSSPR